MKKLVARLALAAIASIACFAGTLFWYESTKPADSAARAEAPIAMLVSSTHEVQRKESGRLIWKPLAERGLLYPGEEVRTSPTATAQIQLEAGNTIINMEPDSVILLDTNKKAPTLEFIKGSLFIAKTGSAEGEELTIKAGDQNMKVGDAEVVLEKPKNGIVNMDVVRGAIDVGKNGAGSNGKNASDITIKVIGPKYAARFLTSTDQVPVKFTWTKLPAGSEVTLFQGSNRRELKEVEGAKADGSLGQLVAPLEADSRYWRLTAKIPNQPDSSSPVYPAVVQRVAPVSLILPADPARLEWSKDQPEVTFQWKQNPNLKKLELEISRDAEFQSLLARSAAREPDRIVMKMNEGEYYWRVSGWIENSEGGPPPQRVASAPRRLVLAAKIVIPPIAQLSPSENAVLTFESLKKGEQKFSWARHPDAASYRLVLKPADSRDPSQEQPSNTTTELDATEKPMRDLAPGRYIWAVEAINGDGERVIASTPRSFTIAQPRPPLKAPMFASEISSPLLAPKTGSVSLRWLAAEGATEYLVDLVPIDDPKNRNDKRTSKRERTKSLQMNLDRLMPGDYRITLRSTNDKDETSPPGQPLVLKVPNQSTVRPPRLKKVNVD